MLRKKNKIFERSLTLPNIKTEELIGRGGFCDVYKISNDIAIKKLVHLREENIQRFKREIKIIEEVSHPNIIKIIDKKIDDETPKYAYTMNLFAYNYEQYVSKVKTLDSFPLEILEKIFLAIIYLHEKGIIHRDLKPSNILINPEPFEVVISDFGLGKLMNVESNLTCIGQGMGTDDYSAPELLLGHQKADVRADIYSLGKILEFTIRELEINCPKEIQQVVKKATEYKMDNRYSSVDDLRREFFNNLMIYSREATIDTVISYLNEPGQVSNELGQIRKELFDNLFNSIIRPTLQQADDRKLEIEFKKILSSPQIINYYLEVASKEFEDYLIFYCELVQALPKFDEEVNFIVSCLYQLIEEPGADRLILNTIWKTLVQLAFEFYKKDGSFKILELIKVEFNKTMGIQVGMEEELMSEFSNNHELEIFYEEYLKESEK